MKNPLTVAEYTTSLRRLGDLSQVPLSTEARKMLEPIVSIAIEAGIAICEVYVSSDVIASQSKADESPVTEADHRANALIVQGLQKAFPAIPIISEESPIPPYTERKSWEKFFLVDPLDGTKEFIKKNGEFTVNIGLIENGVPVLGVIVAPAIPLLYFASREVGTWKQMPGGAPERIYSRPRSVDEPLRLLGSRSHVNPKDQEYIQKQGWIIADTVAIGSSLKFCWLADAQGDLLVRSSGVNEWDAAAGDAIFRYSAPEGKTRFSPLRYNSESLKTGPYVLGPCLEQE